MDLQKLVAQVDDLASSPPFEQWDPPFCGDIDMVIKPDGRWYYMGSPIGRLALVKLFASVLVFEPENDAYYLKTPAEKVRIRVEDAPFVITQWQTKSTEEGPAIVLSTNLDHQVVLSEQHSLINEASANPDAEPALYVEVMRGLRARIHRNVFYQWVSNDEGLVFEQSNSLYLRSGSKIFYLEAFNLVGRCT